MDTELGHHRPQEESPVADPLPSHLASADERAERGGIRDTFRRYSPAAFRSTREALEPALLHWLMDGFSRTALLDEVTKLETRAAVEQRLHAAAGPLATRRTLIGWYYGFLDDFSGLGGRLASWLLLPFMLFATPKPWWAAFLAIPIAIIALLLGFFVAALVLRLLLPLARGLGVRDGRLPAYSGAALLVAMLAMRAHSALSPPWLAFSVWAAAWCVAATLALFLLGVMSLLLAHSIVRRRALGVSPEGTVLAGILTALQALAMPRTQAAAKTVGALIGATLEEIADTVERGLPLIQEYVSREAEARVRQLASGVATRIRAWEADLHTGGGAALTRVESELGVMLSLVARGDWNGLKQERPVAPVRPRARWQAVRLLVAGALPALLLLLIRLHLVPLTGDEPYLKNLPSVAITWASGVVMLLIDSRIAQLLGISSDIRSLAA